jgi:putative copper resistance protein D
VSGSANAYIRLNFKEAWGSGYSYLVVVKVLLTAGLITIGYLHRKNLKKLSEIKGSKFLQLILAEVVIMTGTLAIGSLLASSQPPAREIGSTIDRALSIVGVKMPTAPSLSRILLGYEPDALMIGLLIVAVALYIKGVMVLTKRGDKWPIGRTISFAIGISAVDYATSGGLGLYAHFSFSWHMIAHMTLGMIAPIAIVLGAPITLALRTLPQGRNSEERGVRGTLLSVLHSSSNITSISIRIAESLIFKYKRHQRPFCVSRICPNSNQRSSTSSVLPHIIRTDSVVPMTSCACTVKRRT